MSTGCERLPLRNTFDCPPALHLGTRATRGDRTMIKLTQATIRLNAQARDKTEAIRIAGSLLVDNGNMQSGYIDSMLLREKVANTYLGNGIAIPHGLPKDRDLIAETGISVTQFPEGVQWNRGETVYLVVAIAARSDEHIELLANLTDVLDDPDTVQRLAKTGSAQDIIERLTQSRDGGAAESTQAAQDDFEKWVDVTLTGPAGLHARPATTFVEIAKQFQAEVRVRHLGQGGQRQESGVAAQAGGRSRRLACASWPGGWMKILPSKLWRRQSSTGSKTKQKWWRRPQQARPWYLRRGRFRAWPLPRAWPSAPCAAFAGRRSLLR